MCCVRVPIDLAPKYRDAAPIVGKFSHSHSTARALTRWSHCAVDYIGLYSTIFSWSVRKVWQRKIKFKNYTTHCRTPPALDPAKCDLQRPGIERDMLNFRPERERASQSAGGLMGLIATSLLGTRGWECLHSGSSLPLVFGDHPGAAGLSPCR